MNFGFISFVEIGLHDGKVLVASIEIVLKRRSVYEYQ